LLTTQVIVSAITLFALYKFIYSTLGPANLGLWSLVLATTSVARFTDLGLSGSLGRFVARYRALNDTNQAILVIETGIISVFALLGVVGLLAFPLLRIALAYVIPRDKIGIAFAMLPFAVTSIVVSSVASAVQGALDGCSRLDLRAMLVMAANIIYVLLAVVLSHFHGLIGLAWAQVVQSLLLAAFSWAMLRRVLPDAPILPYRWRRVLFREMIGYSAAYQVAGISMLFYEPVTKMLLAKFGGLADVGVYEMASRVANQFRSLITAPQQSILPLAAQANEKGSRAVIALYEESVRSMFLILFPTLAVLVASAPLISVLWLGSLNLSFIHLLVVLALAVGAQTLIGPSYFTLLGVGSASWVAIGNMTVGISNLLYGLIFAPLYGNKGIIAGSVLALLTGSGVIIFRVHKTYKLSWLSFVCPRNARGLFFVIAALLSEISIEAIVRGTVSAAWAPWAGALIIAVPAGVLVTWDYNHSHYMAGLSPGGSLPSESAKLYDNAQ